jgi:NAD(P)-dependent dehydrogenase (short-subunit alcohol dehydrogenase family)
VVGAARNLDKAHAATEVVRAAAAESGGSLELIELDLASLESVRACANALMWDGSKFDIIIANAGVMACPKGKTADGFEIQFGTNHLGHFVLINRIASLLKPGGRLVNLASAGHRFSDFDLDDPNFDHTLNGSASYAANTPAPTAFARSSPAPTEASRLSAPSASPSVTMNSGLPMPMKANTPRR